MRVLFSGSISVVFLVLQKVSGFRIIEGSGIKGVTHYTIDLNLDCSGPKATVQYIEGSAFQGIRIQRFRCMLLIE